MHMQNGGLEFHSGKELYEAMPKSIKLVACLKTLKIGSMANVSPQNSPVSSNASEKCPSQHRDQVIIQLCKIKFTERDKVKINAARADKQTAK